jgi:hypothetical protein
MRIINFFRSAFHFFILTYWIFLFYWQSKNYENILYENPYIIKIGIPFSIKEFCYQDINGEFSGIVIDILNELFIKKLNIHVDYVCIENNTEFCHCILNVSNQKKGNFIWLHSNPILKHITLLKIKKNTTKNTKFISLKTDVLFLLHANKKNYVFVDSIKEAITFLDNHNEYDLLISTIYYNNIRKTILEKNNKIEDYQIKKIKKKFTLINILFYHTLYWLVNFFNTALHTLKKDQNEPQSINCF